VAETTGFGITGTECGSAFLKIHVDGNYVYTPRLVRPANPAEHPNAIVRAAVLIPALERWALGWEQTQRRVYDDGTVVPRASVGAIRGGLPFKPDRTAAGCDLYMDVRLPPGDGPDTVVMEIEAIMEREGIPGQVTCYASHLGYVGDAQSPVARAAADAYRIVRGTDPPAVASPVCSMWRDTNIFHPAGIPSVTFGPPRQTTPADSSRPGRPCLLLDDLVDTARMYAAVAMTICGVTDGEVLT
jgi:acetylornithine deacetylase/succinyl-diaminopimelate desuccinylase-like protein